jgi:hypothetical protein
LLSTFFLSAFFHLFGASKKKINEQQQYKIALIRYTDDLIGASTLLTGLSLIVAKKGK